MNPDTIEAIKQLNEQIAEAISKRDELIRIGAESQTKSQIIETSRVILLSYKGRLNELLKDPGCCGAPTVETHVAQLADPESWVHASMNRWLRSAVIDTRMDSNS